MTSHFAAWFSFCCSGRGSRLSCHPFFEQPESWRASKKHVCETKRISRLRQKVHGGVRNCRLCSLTWTLPFRRTQGGQGALIVWADYRHTCAFDADLPYSWARQETPCPASIPRASSSR